MTSARKIRLNYNQGKAVIEQVNYLPRLVALGEKSKNGETPQPTR